MKPIHIFRAGSHTASSGETLNFSVADLKGIASSYDPSTHEAPIVVGHPAADGPAYGWVEEVRFGEDGLEAVPHQVDPAFAEMVEAGRFKKVSASFYKPGSFSNPTPKTYHLRHVGFLGAQPPAVKGLKAVAFADGDDDIVTVEFSDQADGGIVKTVFRNLREWMIAEFGLDKANKTLPGYLVDAASTPTPPDVATTAFAEIKTDETYSHPETRQEPDMADQDNAAKDADKAVELAERESAAAARETELAAKEAAFAEEKSKAEAADFIEKKIAEGKVLPRDAIPLVSFMASLNATDAAEFGEGDAGKMTAVEYFRSFIEELPKRVEFSETSKADGTVDDLDDPKAVADKAIAYQEEMKGKGVAVSTTTAVQYVIKGASQ